MTIFKKITEATLLIEKDIKENNLQGYCCIRSIFEGVEKVFPNIFGRAENIIMMRICDNLQSKGVII